MYVALGHCVVYCGDLSAEVVFAFVVVVVCCFGLLVTVSLMPGSLWG